MRWITRLPGLGEWGHVVDYRRAQIDRLDERLEFVPRHAADAGRRARLRRPDLVIVATGAHWVGRRPQRRHPRADPGRGRDAAARADAGAGDGRGQAAARQRGCACRRLRGLLHRRRASPSSCAATGTRSRCVTCLDAVAPYCDQTLEGLRLRRRAARHRDAARTGRAACRVDRRRRDRLAARVRRAVPGWRPTASCWSRSGSRTTALHRELAADPDALAAAGDRGRLPDRRLRRAAPDRRRDLRRPPAWPRDRLARPGAPAAVPARAPARVNRSGQAPFIHSRGRAREERPHDQVDAHVALLGPRAQHRLAGVAGLLGHALRGRVVEMRRQLHPRDGEGRERPPREQP